MDLIKCIVVPDWVVGVLISSTGTAVQTEAGNHPHCPGLLHLERVSLFLSRSAYISETVTATACCCCLLQFVVCCGSCNFFNWMLWINFFRCYHHRYHKLFIYLTADFHTLRAWPSVEAQTNNDMPEREFSILELSWYITNRFRVPNNIIWKTWMCMWLCLPGYLNKLFRKIKFGNLFWYKWQCN